MWSGLSALVCDETSKIWHEVTRVSTWYQTGTSLVPNWYSYEPGTNLVRNWYQLGTSSRRQSDLMIPLVQAGDSKGTGSSTLDPGDKPMPQEGGESLLLKWEEDFAQISESWDSKKLKIDKVHNTRGACYISLAQHRRRETWQGSECYTVHSMWEECFEFESFGVFCSCPFLVLKAAISVLWGTLLLSAPRPPKACLLREASQVSISGRDFRDWVDLVVMDCAALEAFRFFRSLVYRLFLISWCHGCHSGHDSLQFCHVWCWFDSFCVQSCALPQFGFSSQSSALVLNGPKALGSCLSVMNIGRKTEF